MAGVAVSPKVILRDSIGRFIEECRAAGSMTAQDLANEGARLSRELAPKGHKPDPRTPKLVNTITSHAAGTTAHWEAAARHAIAQEEGAPPHDITGQVSFLWEREGRWWNPGSNIIRHPGNPAHPYLKPAYDIVMQTWMNHARRHYPG